MARRLTWSYAIANLQETPLAIRIPAPAERNKHTQEDETTEPEGTDSCGSEDNLETPKEPSPSPMKPKRGRPPKSKPTNEAIPHQDTNPGNTKKSNPEPAVYNGKVLPQRSPLPARTNRNEHPGLVVKPRPKRTSAEVAEAAERKAALQRHIDELEQQRIVTLAEMELQEELEAEETQRAVVKKVAASSGLDDMEDVRTQSGDGEDEDGMTVNADEDSGSEADKAMGGKKPALKGKPVCRVLWMLHHSD